MHKDWESRHNELQHIFDCRASSQWDDDGADICLFGNFVDNETKAKGGFGFAVWRRLLWSLWFAYLGIWPTVDHMKNAYVPGTPEADKAGTPLAGGYFLLIWNIKSDLDHLTKAFGLEHYGSNRPCVLCPATADETQPQSHWFNNFKSTAWWQSRCWSHNHWKERNPDPCFSSSSPTCPPSM